MAVSPTAAGWNSDGDDVELVDSEPVPLPAPAGNAPVPNAISYGAPKMILELAPLIPISTIFLGKPASCAMFADLKSHYEVLTEGDHLIYSVKDETPWHKSRHSLLILSDPAQNPALRLEFIEEHNYNVEIMGANNINNQQAVIQQQPTGIVLNPGIVQQQGIHVNGFMVPMNGMNQQQGMMIGNQFNAMGQKANMWMGYSSPKALKITAASGTEVGTILRKTMTLFVATTPTGEEVFHFELPDIFAMQWHSILSMVVTVKRPSVPTAPAPETMQQLRMGEGCCGSGDKSPNYSIKTVPATTVEEKALLIGAAFMIDMPRRDAAADLRQKATRERLNTANGGRNNQNNDDMMTDYD